MLSNQEHAAWALPVLAQVSGPPVAALLGRPPRQFAGVILSKSYVGIPVLLPVGAQLLNAPAPLLLPVRRQPKLPGTPPLFICVGLRAPRTLAECLPLRLLSQAP